MKTFKNQTSPLYLPHLGIACALGYGKQAVAHSLFKGQSSLGSKKSLLSGMLTPVHGVPFSMPDLPPKFNDLNSRNNSLLRLALDEIAEGVQEALELYGSLRVGVILATSTSGMSVGEEGFSHKERTGYWPEGYEYSQQEIASPSIFASRYFGIQGPAYTISTACSSGSKALCSARRLIMAGICDAVIVGGVDTLCNLSLNGFDSLNLLSEKTCNPFSKNRSGITIGEGAAVFLMTKEKKSSDLGIEFLSGGESSDSHHISSPDPNGEGSQTAIKDALEMASLGPQDIVYINLHGTATTLNDLIESHCIYRIFQSTVPCSSTKALTGHALGASGAIEAAFLWLSLSQEDGGTIPLPPHIWDGEKDPDLSPIRLSSIGERASPVKGKFSLMSNSFAFGGSNVSIILSKNEGG
jgi:3-oxoacyl-[acyl-carrier-protein] synthase-1